MIAAPSQIGVAVEVTLPVLVTVLATVGGILVVGVGGGLIEPMRSRWAKVLNRAERETVRPTTATPPPAPTTETAPAAPLAEPVGNGHR